MDSGQESEDRMMLIMAEVQRLQRLITGQEYRFRGARKGGLDNSVIKSDTGVEAIG